MTNVLGAYVIITNVSPGAVTTGFGIVTATACKMETNDIVYDCSLSSNTNSFIVDVTTVRLLPGNLNFKFYGLTLVGSADTGVSFDA